MSGQTDQSNRIGHAASLEKQKFKSDSNTKDDRRLSRHFRGHLMGALAIQITLMMHLPITHQSPIGYKS